MNIRKYLKQTASWEERTGENDWLEATYDDPVTLPARVEQIQRRVVATGGVEVLSETRVMLEQEVQTGDRIDGQQVQARENIVDLRGRVIGWRAFL